MSTDIIIPQGFGAVANAFASTPVEDDLSAGIQASFGIVGYKGKVWSIRYRGDETQLMREDGDGPKSSINVVIVKSSKHISKIFYKDGYVEGSTAAPDCFSNNGVVPDPASTAKQCDTCALCPHNAWGSRITPAGKPGKACSDSKRIAVVPENDLANEAFGGPMLLRVPAASLQDLAAYGQKMQQLGYPYFSIVTKISFDPAESYPKFKFSAVTPLKDKDANIILPMRDGASTERILNESEYAEPAPVQTHAEQVASAFEQPPETAMDEEAILAAKMEELRKKKAAAAAEEAQKKAAAEAAAKAQAEAAKKAAEEAAKKKAAEEAAAAAAATTTEAEPVDDEEAALMAMLEAARKKKAAAAAAASDPVTIEGNAAEPTQAAQAVDNSSNVASAFEANLDDMLDQMLS